VLAATRKIYQLPERIVLPGSGGYSPPAPLPFPGWYRTPITRLDLIYM